MKKERGVTIFEILLFFGIAAAFIVFGMRVYNQMKFQANAQQLLSNIDQLFLASKNFYESMCRQSLDSSGTVYWPGTQTTGSFDPKVTPVSTTVIRVTVNAPTSGMLDLTQMNMLSAGDWHPANPLVSSTSSYYVEFVRHLTSGADQTMNAYAYTCTGYFPTGPTTNCTPSASTNLNGTNRTLSSSAPLWDIDVAIKLNDCTKAVAYMSALGATCVAQDSVSGGTASITCLATPINCASASSNNIYLLWQRPAALLTQNMSSNLWLSTPLVKQFNMQYTNDSMSSLNGTSSSTSWYNIQNYLCGG